MSADRSRRRSGVLLGIAVASLGLLGVVAARDALAFSLTPTEALSGEHPGQIRVAGLVAADAFEDSAEGSTFVITDGVSEITVRIAGHLPGVVRVGENAVVTGELAAGELQAVDVVLKHSNVYRAGDPGP